MPIYVYECPSCQARKEVFRKVSDVDVSPRCENCLELSGLSEYDDGLEMERVIVPTSFILKGGGWAKDGYS